MAKSRDWDELLYVWSEWRRKSGENMKDMYEQLVEITNEAANYNSKIMKVYLFIFSSYITLMCAYRWIDFSNAGDYWTSNFESADIRQDIENAWFEILPLYELIHAYTRRKLREFHGPNRINRNAPLPEHLLGNMYGQNWANILDITIPYPGRSFLEVTPQMLEQGYNPLIMFQLAEEFFLSINMSAMPNEFWSLSVLEQPLDRVALCQPSAWDFCNSKDYR